MIFEIFKRKAESKLRLGQVQIKPRDPNSFRIGSTNKALTNEKITRRVEANRKDLAQKTMNSNKGRMLVLKHRSIFPERELVFPL